MWIIWDFDYWKSEEHYDLSTYDYPLLGNIHDERSGTQFFGKIRRDPHIQELFRGRWKWFRENKYNELIAYVKEYGKQVEQVIQKDHEVWGPRNSSGSHKKDLLRLLTWLDARANYMNDFDAHADLDVQGC